MMSINDMITALQTAYSVAYSGDLFTEGGSDFIVEEIHEACHVDADAVVESSDYLTLSPEKLEDLFEKIRSIVCIELNEGKLLGCTVGPRMTKRFINVFDLKYR